MNGCIPTVLLTKEQRDIHQAKGSQSGCSLQLIQPADSTEVWMNCWSGGNQLLPTLLPSLPLCWVAACALHGCVVEVCLCFLPGNTAEDPGIYWLLWLQQLHVLLQERQTGPSPHGPLRLERLCASHTAQTVRSPKQSTPDKSHEQRQSHYSVE